MSLPLDLDAVKARWAQPDTSPPGPMLRDIRALLARLDEAEELVKALEQIARGDWVGHCQAAQRAVARWRGTAT